MEGGRLAFKLYFFKVCMLTDAGVVLAENEFLGCVLAFWVFSGHVVVACLLACFGVSFWVYCCRFELNVDVVAFTCHRSIFFNFFNFAAHF